MGSWFYIHIYRCVCVILCVYYIHIYLYVYKWIIPWFLHMFLCDGDLEHQTMGDLGELQLNFCLENSKFPGGGGRKKTILKKYHGLV